MKSWQCDGCGKGVLVPDDYEEEYCCSGYMCGCMGLPIDPILCEECTTKYIGKPVEGDLE